MKTETHTPKRRLRKRPHLRRKIKLTSKVNMKTFINSIGLWELQEDGSIRLVREAKQKNEKSERVKKYACSRKRN